MTDTPAPSSADVIEGMREALKTLTRLRDYAIREFPGTLILCSVRADDLVKALDVVLALPDSKPDNQGGA